MIDTSNQFSSPPRCGHCKQFASEYEKIALTLKENEPPIPVAKVDATKSSSLGSRFEVSGYPTFKIMKKGEPVEYDGAKNEQGSTTTNKTVLVAWLSVSVFDYASTSGPCLTKAETD